MDRRSIATKSLTHHTSLEVSSFERAPLASSDPLPDTATPLLKERMRAVFRQLPKALAGDEESIHQLRVAGRRLRVALPLLALKPEGKRVRRALRGLRELTRATGRSRDLDVILGLFKKRLGGSGAASPESRLLLRRLRTARQRSRNSMAEALLDLEIARLRRDLRAVAARGGDGLFVVLLRLRERREGAGAGLLAEFATLGDRFDPDALHRVRREARRLRYAAEIWDAVRGQQSQAPALFKELQERLGHIHDAWVLACWLGRQAAAAASRGAEALAAEARAHEAVFHEASRAHHVELLERGPAALVQKAMEAMGPSRSAA